MADIKTRDAVKGTIKTIDKAAVASERMKSAYAKTKDKAEQGYYADESSATEYAADRVSCASERVTEEGVHQFNKYSDHTGEYRKDKGQDCRFQAKVGCQSRRAENGKEYVRTTRLADPSRNCKPFCCSRYAPEWEKPAHKDPSAKQENH